MSKRQNMGRKSHHAQDAHLNQNMPGTQDEIGSQKIRPYVHRQQGTKSSKEAPRNTK